MRTAVLISLAALSTTGLHSAGVAAQNVASGVKSEGPTLPEKLIGLTGKWYEYEANDQKAERIFRYVQSGEKFSGSPTIAVLLGTPRNPIDPVAWSESKLGANNEEHIYSISREFAFSGDSYPGSSGYVIEMESAIGIQQKWAFSFNGKYILVHSAIFNESDRRRVWDAVANQLFGGVTLLDIPTETKQ